MTSPPETQRTAAEIDASPALPTVARVLDALTVASLLCAETFAATVMRWMGQRWTVSPLYAIALLIFVVRHVRHPAPSLIARIASGASAAWRHDWTRRIVLIALVTRVAVLGVGYLGATHGGQLLAPANFRLSHNVFWNLPARYDAGWYLGIARNGYEWWPEYAHRQQNIVFFPGFPVAMRVAGDLVTLPARVLRDPSLFGNGNTRVVWGGALVAILAFTLALVQVGRYAAASGLPPDVAFRGAALLACAPFAYFFSAPYSEGLFLLATASTFAAWRTGSAGGVAGWGFVAGLTRSNGWTVSAALFADAALRWREHRQDPRRAIAAFTPILAAALFSAYVFSLTGHPLTWMTAQQAWGNRVTPFGFATARWGHVDRVGFGTYVATDPGDAATVVCVIGVLLLVPVMLWRRQWLEAAFSVAYLVPGMVLDIPSLGRMTSVLFPAYLTLASLLPRSAPGSLRSPGAYGRFEVWAGGGRLEGSAAGRRSEESAGEGRFEARAGPGRSEGSAGGGRSEGSAGAFGGSTVVWIVAAASLALQLFFAFRFFGWRPPY